MNESATRPLYSKLGADPDLSDIVTMFVEEMPDRISKILNQLNASDWEGLRRSAHQLKGAAGSYGFDAISPSAARLEDSILESLPEQQICVAVDGLVEMCRRARSGSPS